MSLEKYLIELTAFQYLFMLNNETVMPIKDPDGEISKAEIRHLAPGVSMSIIVIVLVFTAPT